VWGGDTAVAGGAPSKLQLLKGEVTRQLIDEGEMKRRRRRIDPLARRMAWALGAATATEVGGGGIARLRKMMGIGPVTGQKAEAARLATVKEKEKENRMGLGLGPLRKDKNCFTNFPSTDLNLNSKLKFKSNAFLNSTKFKHFEK
jgi:hypothetical protein